MRIRDGDNRSVVSLPFYGDTFCKGKISEPVPGLDFQRNKVAWKRLKNPGKAFESCHPDFLLL